MAEHALVTGGAGFVGLRLTQALLERGAEVTLVDDFSRGRRDAELEEVLPHARLLEHDLTRPLPQGLDGPPVDTVYHLAAMVGVQRSATAPYEVLRTNLLAAINLLDWCESAPEPPRLMLSSTSEVADGAVAVGLAEPPTPETVPAVIRDLGLPRASYATSKLASELLFAYAARAQSTRAYIVRYHNVYGPRMGHDHVVPQLIDRILARRDPFPVYGFDQTRAFCFVDDAVEATLALTDLDVAAPVTVNIGDDRREVPVRTVVEQLFDIGGFHPEVEVHPPPPGSPERRCPDVSLLRELVDFEPRVDLEEGLRRTFDWYRAEHEAGLAPAGGSA